jgi:hypothetical protein
MLETRKREDVDCTCSTTGELNMCRSLSSFESLEDLDPIASQAVGKVEAKA